MATGDTRSVVIGVNDPKHSGDGGEPQGPQEETGMQTVPEWCSWEEDGHHCRCIQSAFVELGGLPEGPGGSSRSALSSVMRIAGSGAVLRYMEASLEVSVPLQTARSEGLGSKFQQRAKVVWAGRARAGRQTGSGQWAQNWGSLPTTYPRRDWTSPPTMVFNMLT